jgi:23S rRNA pseudouridine1911/1915/1917 synthase
MPPTENKPLSTIIPQQYAGKRLDQALARIYPEFSRNILQQWIKKGHVRVNGVHPRPRDKVNGGESVHIIPQLQVYDKFEAEALPLQRLHEDSQLLIINKPPGLVVHPAAGNWQGTLLNALLYHYPELKRLPRAGIVHRLDKDTSGVMVVARTLQAHKHLVEQLQARLIKREYLTLVQGRLISGGTVRANLGRHPIHRTRMAVHELGGKTAITHYRIAKRYPQHTLLRVLLETGRTHQIRVHMAHLRHPVVGDPVYGGRFRRPAQSSDILINALREFNRQALHARSLTLLHPDTRRSVQCQAPLPKDMYRLIEIMAAEMEGKHL